MKTEVPPTANPTPAETERGSTTLLVDEPTKYQAYLQSMVENEKVALVRQLHDELGGLLVGAIMDLAWADQNWEKKNAAAREKCERARHSVAAAIHLKRRLGERLRPSLLENVGLFAALRWQFVTLGEETGAQCCVDLPEIELRLAPKAAIGLFRTVEEASSLFTGSPRASANLRVATEPQKLTIEIVGTRPEVGVSDGEFRLRSIRQRIALFGGDMSVLFPTVSSMKFIATVPLRNILADE